MFMDEKVRLFVASFNSLFHWMSFFDQILHNILFSSKTCDKITHWDSRPAECFIILVVITLPCTLLCKCWLFMHFECFTLKLEVIATVVYVQKFGGFAMILVVEDSLCLLYCNSIRSYEISCRSLQLYLDRLSHANLKNLLSSMDKIEKINKFHQSLSIVW